MSHREVLASVTAKAAQAPVQMDQPVCMHSSTESSSVPKSEISMPNSTPGVENPLALPQDNASIKQRADQKDFSDHKTQLADTVVMNIPNDGYNWRKYGQKQVKSTESSRSYYRCTYSDCDAKKKVQQCHQSGFVTGVIYKGFHNHDPPPKIRCTQLRKSAAVSPVEGSDTVYPTAQKLGNSDLSHYKSEPGKASVAMPELERQNSSNSDSNTGIKAEEESGDVVERKRRMKPQEPLVLPSRRKQRSSCSSNEIVKKEVGECGDEQKPKQRMKEGGLACSAPLFKTIKEPKIVVHAAGDVGISSDGYRWRKYGQKMVKGNPHPRSYYRCTSAGCPVRKHVERDTDDKTTIIVTYEGKHDHDRPVPKKRHSPRTAAFLIAAAAAMNNNQCKKTETLANQRSSNQQSADMEHDLTCQKALELGGEKALESARTLLSIGIEIKPC